MTLSIGNNLRLALVVLSILAGIAFQEHKLEPHANCGVCIERSENG
ncbi:hypothetical protein [Jannaschia sp. 2305UL9-9]